MKSKNLRFFLSMVDEGMRKLKMAAGKRKDKAARNLN